MGNTASSYYNYYFPNSSTDNAIEYVINEEYEKEKHFKLIKLYNEIWTNKNKFQMCYNTLTEITHKTKKYNPLLYVKILSDFTNELFNEELTKTGNYIVFYNDFYNDYKNTSQNINLDILSESDFNKYINVKYYTYNKLKLKLDNNIMNITVNDVVMNSNYTIETLMNLIIYNNNTTENCWINKLFTKLVKVTNPLSYMKIAFICTYIGEDDLYYTSLNNNDDINIDDIIRKNDYVFIYTDKNDMINITNFYPSNNIKYKYNSVYSELPIIVNNITYK
jgi:hypothetical protein